MCAGHGRTATVTGVAEDLAPLGAGSPLDGKLGLRAERHRVASRPTFGAGGTDEVDSLVLIGRTQLGLNGTICVTGRTGVAGQFGPQVKAVDRRSYRLPRCSARPAITPVCVPLSMTTCPLTIT